MVTREQANALAALAVAIRPAGATGWHPAGIIAAIGRVKDHQLADVAMAVIRAAADPTLDTPGAIGNTQAPCWAERVAPSQPPSNPKPTEACTTCGRRHSTTPPCCDQPSRRHSKATPEAIRAARAALRGDNHE